MEILSVQNLSFSYPKSKNYQLDNISFSVKKGNFVLLSGISGCGKTTLLKMLKPALSPFGKMQGQIMFENYDIKKIDESISAFKIGFVMQNPNEQIVTDKVYSELAFGLQNMGLSNDEMQRRICETSDFFGISNLLYKDISVLSGGQKQLLNLASIIAMNPTLLLLDEPTAQLDPISSTRFFDMLLRVNQELGTTVIIAEHRLNELWSISDKIMLMDKGCVFLNDTPNQVATDIKTKFSDCDLIKSLPAPIQIYNALDIKSKCPLNTRQARDFLSDNFKNDIKSLPKIDYKHSNKIAIELDEVFARYEKNHPDILKGASLKVFEGECVCILGPNGAGKSTLLKTATGLLKSYAGKIKIFDKKIEKYKGNSLYEYVNLLPQNPREIFIHQTVDEDLNQIKDHKKYTDEEFCKIKEQACNMLEIDSFLSMHPFDLSGGQIQKVALAKLLLQKPKILLLDEPVKGLDEYAKQELLQIFKKLNQNNITIIIVTHDVEFASVVANRCAMLWNGQIVSVDVANRFFSNNSFYTTNANKISRHIFDDAITCDDVISLCKRNGGDTK